MLGGIGEYGEAIELYADILREYPHGARVWMSYGHALKTAGRQQDCVEAYRRVIELPKSRREAYWSLANLKTFRFCGEKLPPCAPRSSARSWRRMTACISTLRWAKRTRMPAGADSVRTL